MKIGLPRALLYYRYSTLWKSFFEGLGCEVIVSEVTNQRIVSEGSALSDSECCLPVKVFLGHIASLLGRCDYILAPRFERLGKDEEFCVRFWGLTDIVRGTFPGAPLLSYNLQSHKPGNELSGFLRLGNILGKSGAASLKAYSHAKKVQLAADLLERKNQNLLLEANGLKVLVAAQPYIVYDPCIGGPLVRMVREQGAIPIFAGRCDREACRRKSGELSAGLYWTMNKEVIGAIPLLKPRIDGVILSTAFPCGTDSFVNELVLRRVRDIPVTQIILDEQQGEAGLHTRIECFLDIIKEGRRGYAS